MLGERRMRSDGGMIEKVIFRRLSGALLLFLFSVYFVKFSNMFILIFSRNVYFELQCLFVLCLFGEGVGCPKIRVYFWC